MLGFAASATTSSASTNAGVTYSLYNEAHISYTSIRCATTCSFQHRTSSPSNQSSLATSSKITAFPIQAMAETLTTPKHGSKSSFSEKRQALISLSDKKDLALIGNGLRELGFTIVSTGGTASALESSGVPVTKVEELTSFPEMLDGRVKTLHPNIHGGILARRDLEHHMKSLDKHGIGTFDVVVVNLYPFYEKVSSSEISFEDGIENIDIGGPAMIRAAAKV